MSEEKTEWTSIDSSANKEVEEKIEIEIEGQEKEVDAAAPIKREEGIASELPEKKESISGAEKRIRQLVRQKKERDEQIDSLVAKQVELEEKLKTKQKEAETSFSKSFEDTEQQLKSRIEMAQMVYRQALESGETDLIVKAQENLSNAQGDATALKVNKQQFQLNTSRVEEEPKAVNKPTTKPSFDKQAVEWAGKNPWFGQDQVMTTLALELDNQLKGEGFDPSEPEFYEEIDSRLRNQYPQRFTNERQQDTSIPAQVVGGTSRNPSSTSKNKVRLSKEDIRLAEKWGIPLEQYAAEKLKVERSDGEYTSVYNAN
tara:strand:- start:7088 stop:8032 length:945 start_codon:yes stop_codon:yes gene_type:complete